MPAGSVPDPPALLSSETRSAFYELLNDIRSADTIRELSVYMGRAAKAQRDYRDFFTRIDNELLEKLAELCDDEARVATLRTTRE